MAWLFKSCNLQLSVVCLFFFQCSICFPYVKPYLFYEGLTSDLINSAFSSTAKFSLAGITLRGYSFAICNIPDVSQVFSSFLK